MRQKRDISIGLQPTWQSGPSWGVCLVLEFSLHSHCCHPPDTACGQSTSIFFNPVIHVTLCREFISVVVNIIW